ncbi:hypothetical protein RHRU231_230038 [Rhodococcus ruber]|uniref:Uncharacterized protein n=1 Tax=Rhodococcus ruber TaxID=1830 RepID=A0A098BG59_9NOCA|nr:hypothetical protein RHRU231_230038 [Rhodococcus ruber]
MDSLNSPAFGGWGAAAIGWERDRGSDFVLHYVLVEDSKTDAMAVAPQGPESVRRRIFEQGFLSPSKITADTHAHATNRNAESISAMRCANPRKTRHLGHPPVEGRAFTEFRIN